MHAPCGIKNRDIYKINTVFKGIFCLFLCDRVVPQSHVSSPLAVALFIVGYFRFDLLEPRLDLRIGREVEVTYGLDGRVGGHERQVGQGHVVSAGHVTGLGQELGHPTHHLGETLLLLLNLGLHFAEQDGVLQTDITFKPSQTSGALENGFSV